MKANGTSELTIRILKTGRHIVGQHLCRRDDKKWPSISERRSPTERAPNRSDRDRKEMSANGMTELTIQMLKN